MALQRALDMLRAGEEINDRLYQSAIGGVPGVSSRWTSSVGHRPHALATRAVARRRAGWLAVRRAGWKNSH
jgi:hypothetical protein